jgi:hypothetical protein
MLKLLCLSTLPSHALELSVQQRRFACCWPAAQR